MEAWCIGIGKVGAPGPFDYAINYLFFVPNLLIAEYFIRNHHKRRQGSRPSWPLLAASASVAAVFVYAIIAASATATGKYGSHLVRLITGG